MANTGLSKWAGAQWGGARWAFRPEIIGGNLIAQGIMLGTGSLANLLNGAATIIEQGIFQSFISCPRDMVLQSIQMPRSTIAVVMPVAFVSQINMPGDIPGCTGTTTTVPATGSFNSLVELSSVPQNN